MDRYLFIAQLKKQLALPGAEPMPYLEAAALVKRRFPSFYEMVLEAEVRSTLSKERWAPVRKAAAKRRGRRSQRL